MSDPLPLIAAKLAAALRNMPCTCKKVDHWPVFGATTRVKVCTRCAALDEYDAMISICQLPGVPVKEQPK